MRFLTYFVLLLPLGCSSTESSICGDAEYLRLDGAEFCRISTRVVIEGGFECPPELAFASEIGEFTICSVEPLDPSMLPRGLCDDCFLPDAGPDGGGASDAGPDAGPDAGSDAGSDAGTDAGCVPELPPVCGMDSDCDGALLDTGEVCDDGTNISSPGDALMVRPAELDGCSSCEPTEVFIRSGGARPQAIQHPDTTITLVDGSANVTAQRYSASGELMGASLIRSYSSDSGSVVVGAGANAVVVWDDARTTSPTIRAAIVQSSGMVIPVTVGEPGRGAQRAPQVAGFSDGSFVVAWRNIVTDGPDEILARRYTALGAAEGALVVVDSSERSLSGVQVATNGDGFVVGYRRQDSVDDAAFDLLARRFSAAGTPLGAELLLATGTSSAELLSLSEISTGELAALYLSEPDAPLNLQWLTSDGTSASPAIAVGDAVGSFGIHVVVGDDDRLQVTRFRFEPEGTAFRASAVVIWIDRAGLDSGPFVANENTNAERNSSSLPFADGSFLVLWRDGDRRTFVRKFAADLTPLLW